MNERAVDFALRQVLAYADYDLHKAYECDEETGEDEYRVLVQHFMFAYHDFTHAGVPD